MSHASAHTNSDPYDDPNSPVLSLIGLARYLGLPHATLKAARSRSPDSLPPPYHRRPLRWRRSTVDRWLTDREREEEQRIEQSLQPLSRRRSATSIA